MPIIVPASSSDTSSRPLTKGEITMARSVFGDQIDYDKVKIHHLPSAVKLITAGNIITPNGEIYASGNDYRDDYSAYRQKKDETMQSVFMHEMTHVWQHQKGHSVVGEALSSFVKFHGEYREAYAYNASAIKSFYDMNLEQQADFIGDYQIRKYWNSEPGSAFAGTYTNEIAGYESILKAAGFPIPPVSSVAHDDVAHYDVPAKALGRGTYNPMKSAAAQTISHTATAISTMPKNTKHMTASKKTIHAETPGV